MESIRRLLLLLLAVLALALLAGEARAEEIFILDNGVVLRGRVAREGDGKVVIRLAGFREENTVTVRESEIARRFVNAGSRIPKSDDESAEPLPPLPAGYPLPPSALPTTSQPDAGPDDTAATAPYQPTVLDEPIPRGEPSLQSEGFFERLQRVTGLALPKSFEGLLLLAFLAFVVLTVLVEGGSRALGMKAPSLHASSSLGLLLGIFLAADFLMHDEILRADRAIWILPLQAAVWLVVARTALDAPLSKTVPLFAFVLFGSTCFMFFTGSLLVSV